MQGNARVVPDGPDSINAAKHMLAVRLSCNDPELRAAADKVAQAPREKFDLFAFWFDRSF